MNIEEGKKRFEFDIDHFEKYGESMDAYLDFLRMLAYREYEFSVKIKTMSSSVNRMIVEVKDWQEW